jgi:hypothetical protein
MGEVADLLRVLLAEPVSIVFFALVFFALCIGACALGSGRPTVLIFEEKHSNYGL